MALDRRLVGSHIHFIRITEFGDLGILDINGDVNEDRPLSSGICHIKGFLENSGNIIHIPDKVAVFYKGFRRARNIGLLEHIAAKQLAVHLSGNADQGYAVCKGCCNAGDQIGRPGA